MSTGKNSKYDVASSMIYSNLCNANISCSGANGSNTGAQTEVVQKKLVSFSRCDMVHEVPNLTASLTNREKKSLWYSEVELWTIQQDLKREVVRKRMKTIHQRMQKGKMPYKDLKQRHSHSGPYGHRRIRKKVEPALEIPIYLEWQ
mmetsp:Transcript_27255/g.74590  ORF Transcript_27255/g.74590 Transcript_27255/m.74590 type:complete len:146 (+) Transcript_27255:372-809(+)